MKTFGHRTVVEDLQMSSLKTDREGRQIRNTVSCNDQIKLFLFNYPFIVEIKTHKDTNVHLRASRLIL